jgi:Kef-type K+ transport system membrane component KefB
MAGGSFIAILRISGFLTAVWAVGKLAKVLSVSSIVFEIAVGLLLSPGLGDKLGIGLAPKVYGKCPEYMKYDTFIDDSGSCTKDAAKDAVVAWVNHDEQDRLYGLIHHMEVKGHCADDCCKSEYKKYSSMHPALDSNEFNDFADCIVKECNDHMSHYCQVEPDILTLIGHTGVSMMIFESGMHFDFERAKFVGPRACVVAVLGTFLPIGAGMGLIYAFGKPVYPYGIAAGVSLAPTSVGIALRLLLEAKQLQKDFGQAIITAAFVDDILSLIAYNILFQATEGAFTFQSAILPSLIGCVLMVLGAGLGMKFWPMTVEYLMAMIPNKAAPGSLSRQDEVLLLLIFGLLIGYSTITFYLGTHLWGCFVAGMSFAMIHHVHHVWVRQVKRVTVWMLRIFFSCTVAFAIPYTELASFEALWKGTIMGVVACIFTKVICAFFMGEARFVIGWAMVGRAEFAYLIAAQAKAANIMDDETFAIIIWALLYATIFAPFCFRKVLAKYSLLLHERELLQQAQLELEAEKDVPRRDPSNQSLSEKRPSQAFGRGISGNDLSRDISLGLGRDSLTNPHAQRASRRSIVRLIEVFNKFKENASNRHYGTSAALSSKAGHTVINGYKWLPDKELTAFRFQIIYKKENFCSVSVEEMSEIWDLLRKQGIVVTQMDQQCDHDTHCATMQIQPTEGETLEASEISFIQEEVFAELKGLGAHIVYLPPMHALQSKCKLAKVTVMAFTGSKAGADNISKIVSGVEKDGLLYVMRAGLELHGDSTLLQFLIAHTGAEAPDGSEIVSQRSSRDMERSQVAEQRKESRQNVQQAGMSKKTQAIEMQLHQDHLHVGTRDLPDITPKELFDLKKRIENSIEGWCQTIVDPLTFGLGPTGDLSHDWRTLMEGQQESAACEIRFHVTICPKKLFSQVILAFSRHNFNVLSARMDDRSVSKINIVASASLLGRTSNVSYKNSGDDQNLLASENVSLLLDDLQKVCVTCGVKTGHIDIADVNVPLEKQFRIIGQPMLQI